MVSISVWDLYLAESGIVPFLLGQLPPGQRVLCVARRFARRMPGLAVLACPPHHQTLHHAPHMRHTRARASPRPLLSLSSSSHAIPVSHGALNAASHGGGAVTEVSCPRFINDTREEDLKVNRSLCEALSSGVGTPRATQDTDRCRV